MKLHLLALVASAVWIGQTGAASASQVETPVCASGDAECGAQAFSRGTESFDAGDYGAAAKWFAAAARANPHPTVLFNQALSEARSGQLLGAAERFRSLLADPTLDPSMRARIERELTSTEGRLARVTFEGPRSGEARIFLDEIRVTPSGDEIRMDPGTHHLKVELGADVVYDQQLDVTEGERVRLRVSGRTRAIDVVVVPGSRSPGSRPVDPLPASSGVSPAVFYTAAAGTLALAGLTVWSGLDVQGAHDEYRADLPRLTQAEADRRVADGHDGELRTNLLLGSTLVLAAGTAALGIVFVDWGGQDGGPGSLVLTPSGGALRGTF